MRLMLALALILALAGCALLPSPPPPAVSHDLGALPEARVALPWQLEVQVDAPPWLDDGQVYYRHHGATRLAAYRDHRWAAPPSELLARRLQDRLAPATPDAPGRWLGIELASFEQRFVDGGAEAWVAARVLVRERRGGALLASRDFALRVPAASADVDGGVAALATALDRLAAAVIDWLAVAAAEPQA
jgi:cholesterol transport system auxiliary component